MRKQVYSFPNIEPWPGVETSQWLDWKWQFRNRITRLETLKEYMPVTNEEEKAFQAAGKNLPFAVTPYYLDLVKPCDVNDPIRKTVIPRIAEFTTSREEMIDPCGEDHDMVAPGLVHRYPDRVLFLVNETCSVYCRYCTRSRVVGSSRANLFASIAAGISASVSRQA